MKLTSKYKNALDKVGTVAGAAEFTQIHVVPGLRMIHTQAKRAGLRGSGSAFQLVF